MFKKSQAALEFLTTYAWAFLVILIMIGALAYFGILSPNKLLPDRCVIGTDLGCEDYTLSWGTGGTTGTARLKIRNNLPDSIDVTAVSLIDPSDDLAYCTNAVPGYDITQDALGSDKTTDFIFNTCDVGSAGFQDGSKGKIDISITYHISTSTALFSHVVLGELFATLI